MPSSHTPVNYLTPCLETTGKIADDVMKIEECLFGSAATAFCKHFFENLLHCAPCFVLTLSTDKTTIGQCIFIKSKEGLLESQFSCERFSDQGEGRAHLLTPKAGPVPQGPFKPIRAEAFVSSGLHLLLSTWNLKRNYIPNVNISSLNPLRFCPIYSNAVKSTDFHQSAFCPQPQSFKTSGINRRTLSASLNLNNAVDRQLPYDGNDSAVHSVNVFWASAMNLALI